MIQPLGTAKGAAQSYLRCGCSRIVSFFPSGSICANALIDRFPVGEVRHPRLAGGARRIRTRYRWASPGGIRPEFGALFDRNKASVLERICSPAVRSCFGLLFLRDYSAGSVGGGATSRGTRPAGILEICAELIAQGFAVWRTPSPKGEELVAARANVSLSAPTFDSDNDSRVDVGWQSNG